MTDKPLTHTDKVVLRYQQLLIAQPLEMDSQLVRRALEDVQHDPIGVCRIADLEGIDEEGKAVFIVSGQVPFSDWTYLYTSNPDDEKKIAKLNKRVEQAATRHRADNDAILSLGEQVDELKKRIASIEASGARAQEIIRECRKDIAFYEAGKGADISKFDTALSCAHSVLTFTTDNALDAAKAKKGKT